MAKLNKKKATKKKVVKKRKFTKAIVPEPRTAKDNEAQIDELLDRLRGCGPGDPAKKGLRARLRTLGHTGGLKSLG